VRILKIMETLVDMTFSVVLMTLSDCDPDSINKKNNFEKSCENDYSILFSFPATYCLETKFKNKIFPLKLN